MSMRFMEDFFAPSNARIYASGHGKDASEIDAKGGAKSQIDEMDTAPGDWARKTFYVHRNGMPEQISDEMVMMKDDPEEDVDQPEWLSDPNTSLSLGSTFSDVSNDTCTTSVPDPYKTPEVRSDFVSWLDVCDSSPGYSLAGDTLPSNEGPDSPMVEPIIDDKFHFSCETRSDDSSDLSVWSETIDEKVALDEDDLTRAIISLAQLAVSWHTMQRTGSETSCSACCDGTQRQKGITSSDSGKNKRKHDAGNSRRLDSDQCDDDEDNDEQDRRKRRGTRLMTDHLNPKLLACPFSKHDPTTYRKCYKYVLKDTAKLKQHLSRCHKTPIYCPRCSLRFESETVRDGHIRDEPCEKAPVQVFDGINEVQRKKLEQRVSSKNTMEQNWYAIYGILFPEDSPPDNPYIPELLSQELAGLQDLLLKEGPALLRKQVAQTSSMCDVTMDALIETAFPAVISLLIERWEVLKAPGTSSKASTQSIPSDHLSSHRTSPPIVVTSDGRWQALSFAGPSQPRGVSFCEPESSTNGPGPVPEVVNSSAASSCDPESSPEQPLDQSIVALAPSEQFCPSLEELLNLPIFNDGSLFGDDYLAHAYLIDGILDRSMTTGKGHDARNIY